MRYLFTPLLFIAFSIQVFAQADSLHAAYFKTLTATLAKDPAVRKVTYYEKLRKDSTLVQSCFVKYRGSLRKWRAGKLFLSYRGALFFTDYVNPQTRTLTDTAFYFDESGQVQGMIIYHPDLRERQRSKTAGVPGRAYVPKRFDQVNFSEGFPAERGNYVFTDNKGYVLDGKYTFYAKNGTIEKAVRYSMGKEVAPIGRFPYKNGDITYSDSIVTDTSLSRMRLLVNLERWQTQTLPAMADSVKVQKDGRTGLKLDVYKTYPENTLLGPVYRIIVFTMQVDVKEHGYSYTLTSFRCDGFQAMPLEAYYKTLFKTKSTELLLYEIDRKIKQFIERFQQDMRTVRPE